MRSLWFLVCFGAAACAHPRSATFDVRRAMAERLIGAREYEAALDVLSSLHAEAPEDAAVLVLRGTAYLERGLLDVAEKDLRAAVEIDDDLAEGHARLAMLLDLTARGPDADRHHRRAVELEPRSVIYLNNLGFSCFARGRSGEAVQFYEEALRLEPSASIVRTNLGFAYAALRDMSSAAREFDRADGYVRDRAAKARAKNNLGYAYERQGNLPEAFDRYLEAVQLSPELDRAWRNLEVVAAKLGRTAPPRPSSTPPTSSAEPQADPAIAPSDTPSASPPAQEAPTP